MGNMVEEVTTLMEKAKEDRGQAEMFIMYVVYLNIEITNTSRVGVQQKPVSQLSMISPSEYHLFLFGLSF